MGNCDGNAVNGCEASLTTLTNCGTCGSVCNLANATESCGTGTCALGTCTSSWLNCDGNPANGCETNGDTDPNHCGACGAVCQGPNVSTAVCQTRVCYVATCNAGWGDCNGSAADGCEVDLTSSTANCGACGQPCSGSCSGGVCTLAAPGGGCIAQVDAGSENLCALRTDGTVWCLGMDTYGQLGNGPPMTASNTPVQASISGVRYLDGGVSYTCAVRGDGSTWCWGGGGAALGWNGAYAASSSPLRVGYQVGASNIYLAPATQVAAWSGHACARHVDGTASCWGANDVGQIGIGTLTPTAPPRKVVGLSSVVQVDVGFRHTCAVRQDGSLTCWGNTGNGNLGFSGNAAGGSVATLPAPVPAVAGVAQVASGDVFYCGRTNAGGVFCAGDDALDALGRGAGNNSGPPAPLSLPGSVVQVASGMAHACALLSTGALWCWGNTQNGQASGFTNVNDFNATEPIPKWVASLGTSVAAVSAGYFTTCVIRTDGSVACFGKVPGVPVTYAPVTIPFPCP